SLYNAKLTGAGFAGANVIGADFGNTTQTGLTAVQLYDTASYQISDLAGIQLSANDLSGWNFAHQNLIGADFSGATLTGASFSGAHVQNASFRSTVARGFTASQLYSTASYQAHDL